MNIPKLLALSVLGLFTLSAEPVQAADEHSPGAQPPRWSLALHGGAGTIRREAMSAERQADYEAALAAALDTGARILADGGEALDAVTAVIVQLEDDPKFNAGRGAVFTWDGAIELDAAIMDGRDRSAGAVTGVVSIKNPILLAREVMRDGRHVFLSGRGAESFASDRGLETAAPEYFETEPRRRSLDDLKARRISALGDDTRFGTVGAVARDAHGNLAAGTSTGGLTGKRWGRIGDAPIIGAGTYADEGCAVSATGAGEYFIRVGVARMICARTRLMGEGGQVSADAIIAEVEALGGDGGVIVLAGGGDPVFSFNTAGMYRARANSDGMREIGIYGPE